MWRWIYSVAISVLPIPPMPEMTCAAGRRRPPATRLVRSASSSAALPVKLGLRGGISLDRIDRDGTGTDPAGSRRTGGVVSGSPSCHSSSASSVSRAACQRAWNSSRSPFSCSTTSSRKVQRGTREPRNMLWTVEELMTPRPTPAAISRIEGRPAAKCSSSRRSKSSVMGPGGVGLRLIAGTVGSPPCCPAMSNFVKTRTRWQWKIPLFAQFRAVQGYVKASTCVKPCAPMPNSVLPGSR